MRCAAVSHFGVTAASIEVDIGRMSVNQQLRIKAPKKLLSMFAKAAEQPSLFDADDQPQTTSAGIVKSLLACIAPGQYFEKNGCPCAKKGLRHAYYYGPTTQLLE